jgi:hypothetical protein
MVLGKAGLGARGDFGGILRRVAGLAVAIGMVAASTSALAQWAWKEDNGRMVYSDRPPPSNIKQSQITRQPTLIAPAPPPTPVAPGAAAAPGQPGPAAGAAAAGDVREPTTKAGPKTIADQELEFRKRQQAREAAEKKSADDEAKASQQAQDCDRVKGYIQSLESGVRITRTDNDGNPHFLDDSERAAELDRSRATAAKTCAS